MTLPSEPCARLGLSLSHHGWARERKLAAFSKVDGRVLAQGLVRERSLSARLSKKLESNQEESVSGIEDGAARMEGVRERAAMSRIMGALAVMLDEIGLWE